MPEPDALPTDEQLAALLSALEKDAAPPDRAFLERLRARSLEAFDASLPVTPRKPPMLKSSFRWLAALAAVLLVGIAVAQWIVRINRPDPVNVVQDDKFALQGKLADDGRIGHVTDTRGVVSVKPVLHERWSPVQPRLVLKPGDWLRTDSRGANAVAIRLVPATGVIVGPHSTVELVKPTELHLLAGEIEIAATAETPIDLQGPDKQSLKVESRQLYRVEKEKLVRVEAEPVWLAGFKGTTTNESIGSLIATVDGRNVPLTVGFHRVTVDIRDQIARTTIEESFVNRSGEVLEGVFHFPLPADASISGFGMWIGDRLVEADVVEKQRAREIFETILREKRDPGLLEWTGGNIFKARVYPIPAYSEKRIKISYTQVLPRQGHRYRYGYALQSELLRQHPLRELTIDVKVNSAVPLKNVSSPIPVRVERTEHSGHIEFTAQEYTPSRDFEAVIEVEGKQTDVVVIPHRRGEDGYFMVQLTPPGSTGDWERPLIPNGDPLHLLILADTSASMDSGQRTVQNAVLASLLGSLTAKDTLNVAACDVNCDWLFEKPVAATAENVAAIQKSLTKRTSLGWTDLDKTFASAMKMSEPGTHVIYIGDGIVTTGDADPVAFAKRLHRLYQGHAGTFHAITVGSSYEPAAIKAIASLGGGSVRRVSGERGPQAAALELLSEIASPTLRDVKVSFTGIRTARVYPEDLPNLAAGSQQILLGRYLPEGKDQTGEIVITGMLGQQAVRFTSPISLKDAEQGNSFIPRLWARMHLDKLLEQGTSEAIQQEVIALSEEFNIITPYTSLLVLESDADRERFAVKRRFQMRDGEKFFADGQANANFELKQKQMKQSGDFRTALRRQVLSQLQSLGRNARLYQMPSRMPGLAGKPDVYYLGDRDEDELGLTRYALASSGRLSEAKSAGDGLDYVENNSALGFERGLEEFAKRESLAGESDKKDAKDAESFDRLAGLEPTSPDFAFGGRLFKTSLSDDVSEFDGVKNGYIMEDEMLVRSQGKYFYRRSRGYGYQPSQLPWLGTLFPNLAQPAAKPKETKSEWPAAALALSRSLLRTDTLAKLKGGVVLERQSDRFDGRGDEMTTRSRRRELVSPQAWLARTMPEGGPVTVHWCDAKECGLYNVAFQLGRVQGSNEFDRQHPPAELIDYSITALDQAYTSYEPTIENLGPDRSLLILKPKNNTTYQIRFLIDTTRHVLLSVEERVKDKVNSAKKFDDFAEIAGVWWARRVETFNNTGHRDSVATQTIAELAADDFAKRMTQELASKAKVQFLRQPLPSVLDAKASVTANRATFDDRAALTLHFAASQQWSRAKEHLEQCEKLAAGKTGMRWLTNAFLFASRRHEELRKRLIEDAAALAGSADADVRANEYFLAEYLIGQAQQVLQTNESAGLSDQLKAIYDHQPAQLHAAKTWRTRQISFLYQAGQSDRALELSKALAVDYPRDYQLQTQYAQNLANNSNYEAAYAWLNRALEAKWEPAEVDAFRNLYAQFLQQQGRHRELADLLAKWIDAKSESDYHYGLYLSALVYSNRAAKAETLVAQWLREGLVNGELPRTVAARLSAAISFALGHGHNLYTNRVDERWYEPLAEVSLFFAKREEYSYTVNQILQHHIYQSTDRAVAVRKKLAGMLLAEIDTMPPAQVGHFLDWSETVFETADWQRLADALRKRWDAEKKPDTRHALGQSLLRALGRLGNDKVLAFLRVQLQEAPVDYRSQYRSALYQAILSQLWTAEGEAELFTLLDQLHDTKEPAAGLASRVAALHRLDDAMLEARYQSLMKMVEHPEKLTRTELQAKQAENRKRAREGVAERLRLEAAKRAKPFASWMIVERLWIEALLERNLPQIATECWAYLDTPPVKANTDDESSAIESTYDELLRMRFFTMLENLAARKGADAALIDHLLKYVDARMKEPDAAGRWRSEKYWLLIALDRPVELEAELRQWLAAPEPESRWRLALGRILAEQGKVAEAIKLFEVVEAADELNPTAYRSLAEWYLVENRREQHEKARAALYKTTEEYQLSRRIAVCLQPWLNAGHLPTRFDPEVLDVFKVLFEKSTSPQQYLGSVQQFYQASRDFRLLAMLADGSIGHTAGKIYPFLAGMGGVLSEVRDEATADELVARIALVRVQAKTTIDQRALDFLELLVERRAAELQNQPGPHAERALAALVRAGKREWSPGEPRLMADFLAGLGAIPQAALAAEQLRLLESFHVGASGFDRLHIAHRRAEALNAYKRRPEAIDLLQAALQEFATANKGVLPVSANSALNTLIDFNEAEMHFVRGENLLLDQIKHPIHAEQKNWLAIRLNELYLRALQNKGDVSLGNGTTLYKALERRLIAALDSPDPNHRSALLDQLCRAYRVAHGLAIAGVADDLKAFAFDHFAPIIREQSNNTDNIIYNMSQTVHDVAGAREGIAFLLDRVENPPDWQRYTNQNGWQQYSHRLGEWQQEVKDLGSLEPRFLNFVLAELRRDLRSRQQQYRTLYARNHNYYWQAKEAEFAKVAEQIYAERKGSGTSVEYIAQYLYHGVAREKRAIEILFAAHEQKILAESGQWQLVDYLHQQKRFAESIPLLLPLVETRPENLSYRIKLMHAYHRTGKPAELLSLLKQTDTYFHEKDRWNEGALAGLASSCLENGLYQQSVAYYDELIPLHQRTQPRRGIGNGTLSTYYSQDAQAFAGLGKTKEAVDRASGAVVSWMPHQQQRKDALESLVQVLVKAPDLAAYVTELDKEKLQSAVVRKAIGQAYLRKNDSAMAIRQLQLAAELQPNDAEIYRDLVACYDKVNDKEGAIRQLLQSVELSRRDIKLFEQLGTRYTAQNQPADAERAYTSIVEMQAQESESHTLLAEIREKQNRWPEAIAHWERVAQIRSLEPTGLLKLASAQLHEKEWDKATATLQKLRSRTWPPRFGDVQQQARELEGKLKGKPKK